MQNVMHIATNAGQTKQNDGWNMQNYGRPCVMLAATHLLLAKDQRGGLRSPPGPPPTPIHEMIFRTLGTKKIKCDN